MKRIKNEMLKICRDKVNLSIFISTLVIGMITHITMFTNKFFNNDDVGKIFFLSDFRSTGRWMISILSEISSNYNVPIINGILSIIMLSVTAVFIKEIFEFKIPLFGLIAGAILVTYPVCASTFSYMFLSDVYFEGVFLVILGVWLWKALQEDSINRMWGYLLIILCWTLSLGIYQAYICLAIGICYFLILYKGITGGKRGLELFLSGCNFIFLLMASFILYFIITFLVLKLSNISLADYQNVKEMGRASIRDYYHGILNSYKGFYSFLMATDAGTADLLTRLINIVLCFFTFGYCLCMIFKTSKSFLSLVMLLCMPMAIESIYLIAANSGSIHHLMIFARVLWYFIFIFIVSDFIFKARSNVNWHRSIFIILLIILTCNQFKLTNISYYKMQVIKDNVYSWATRLALRIEETDGYSRDCKVLIATTGKNDNLPIYPFEFPETELMTGTRDINYWTKSASHLHRLMETILYCQYMPVDADEAKKICETQEFKMMPLYPGKDSIQWIDNVLIVKIRE